MKSSPRWRTVPSETSGSGLAVELSLQQQLKCKFSKYGCYNVRSFSPHLESLPNILGASQEWSSVSRYVLSTSLSVPALSVNTINLRVSPSIHEVFRDATCNGHRFVLSKETSCTLKSAAILDLGKNLINTTTVSPCRCVSRRERSIKSFKHSLNGECWADGYYMKRYNHCFHSFLDRK